MYFSDHPNTNFTTYSTGPGSPIASDDGWELSFNVNPGVDHLRNPRASTRGNFYGSVTNKIDAVGNTHGSGTFAGFFFNQIWDEGDYKIRANFNDTGPYEILYKATGSTNYVNYTQVRPNAVCEDISDYITPVYGVDLTHVSTQSRIQFNSQGSNAFSFVGAIDNISLTN